MHTCAKMRHAHLVIANGTMRRLDGLTSARFFACLWVVLFHFAPPQINRIPLLGPLVRHGYHGVSFFFVLSGFILVAVYAPRAREEQVDRRKFYVARLARIYPVYVFSLLLAVAGRGLKYGGAGSMTLHDTLTDLVLRLTFLSTWVPGRALQLNTAAWTLSVEALFYALFPFLLIWLLRASALRRRALVLAFLLVGILVPCLVHVAYPENRQGSPFHYVTYLPLVHLGTFLVGCEAGMVYLAQGARPSRRLSCACGFSLALILALAIVDAGGAIGIAYSGLLAIPFALIVLWLARNEGRLSLMRSAPLVLLGEVSYGAYVLQFPFVSLVYLVARRTHVVPEPSSGFFGIAVLAILLFAFSVLVYFALEIPMRRTLRRLLEPRGSIEARSAGLGIERPVAEGSSAQDP